MERLNELEKVGKFMKTQAYFTQNGKRAQMTWTDWSDDKPKDGEIIEYYRIIAAQLDIWVRWIKKDGNKFYVANEVSKMRCKICNRKVAIRGASGYQHLSSDGYWLKVHPSHKVEFERKED